MKFADEAEGTISPIPRRITRIAWDDGNRFEQRAVGVGNFVVSNGNRGLERLRGCVKRTLYFLTEIVDLSDWGNA